MMCTLRAVFQFEFLMANSEGYFVVVALVALYAVTTIVDDFFRFAVFLCAVCCLLSASVFVFCYLISFCFRFAFETVNGAHGRQAAGHALVGGRGQASDRLANAVLLSSCLPFDK